MFKGGLPKAKIVCPCSCGLRGHPIFNFKIEHLCANEEVHETVIAWSYWCPGKVFWAKSRDTVPLKGSKRRKNKKEDKRLNAYPYGTLFKHWQTAGKIPEEAAKQVDHFKNGEKRGPNVETQIPTNCRHQVFHFLKKGINYSLRKCWGAAEPVESKLFEIWSRSQNYLFNTHLLQAVWRMQRWRKTNF